MHNGNTTWDSTKFPHLRILGCPGDLTASCLGNSNSHVSRLRWTQGVPDDRWSPFDGIRSLDLFLFTIDIQVFSRIICKFPSLEYLKCTVQPDRFLVSTGTQCFYALFTNHSRILQERITDEDRKRLSSLNLSSLRKVYVHMKRPRQRDRWNCDPLFACIPSLRVVQLQFPEEPTSQLCHRKDPSQWVQTPPEPDEWKYFEPVGFGSSELEETLGQMSLIDDPRVLDII